jgi:RNA polymerase sigma-70 factor (ECF subfamily)
VGETTDFLRRNPSGNTEYLIDKARDGSEAAWREILRRYHTMLGFHVRARIHGISTPDVEDLLQRVLSKVVVHIRKFEYRGEGSFRKWLAKLVVNECKNEIQSQAALQTESRELTEVEDVARAHSEELSAERRNLLEKLGELEADDRDLLIMRYFEKMAWDAIADVLGCSIEKVKSDYDVAFQRLSRRLGA